jgi:hypothetical protein
MRRNIKAEMNESQKTEASPHLNMHVLPLLSEID